MLVHGNTRLLNAVRLLISSSVQYTQFTRTTQQNQHGRRDQSRDTHRSHSSCLFPLSPSIQKTKKQSGIGTDIAKNLITSGWKVACVGRRKEAGEALEAELGANARFFAAEIAQYASQAAVFQDVHRLWGHIDVFIANAGIVDQSSLYLYGWQQQHDKNGHGVDELPPEPDLSCTDTDYKGVIYGVQLARHFMRYNQPQPGGRIVVTSSVGGVFPHPAYPEYNGAKAAVNQFVRGMAPLLRQREKIYLNCVLPGIVATPIVPPEMIEAVTPEWYFSPALPCTYSSLSVSALDTNRTQCDIYANSPGSLSGVPGGYHWHGRRTAGMLWRPARLLSHASSRQWTCHPASRDSMGAFIPDNAWR